jgi:hypothetical protein
VEVPVGTVVYGYGKRGNFHTRAGDAGDVATSDKSVGLGFHDTTTAVLFQK